MKIAIDLDGTAWDNQKFFKDFMNLFQAIGYEIGILTAHYDEQFHDKDLFLWSQRGFPKPDFYIARIGEEEHKTNVGEWKAKMMDKHDIDVLFEDFDNGNPVYVEHFFEHVGKNKIIFRLSDTNKMWKLK